MMFPISSGENGAIAVLMGSSNRLDSRSPQITDGFNERTAVQKGIISRRTSDTVSWKEVILQPTHISVALPLSKNPDTECRSHHDYAPWDITNIDVAATPRTNYVRSAAEPKYAAAQAKWIDSREPGRNVPYTKFFRVAWRRRIVYNSERYLHAAIIPPGAAHVHTVNSMALGSDAETVLVAGSMAALPVDYFVALSGISDLQRANAVQLPSIDPGHPLVPEVLLRTLRLNSLTSAYSALWENLYTESWRSLSWALEWEYIQSLGDVKSDWSSSAPLRTEYERRAALVEIDALVAVMLGLSAEQLISIFVARYPILVKREGQSWFDATGRKIVSDSSAFGLGQKKEDNIQLQAHLNDGAPPPSGYSPPFYKADRVAEMTAAHAEFTRRLEAKQAEAGS
jgi:hypothetical protein